MEKRYTLRVSSDMAKELYDIGAPLRVKAECELNPFSGRVERKTDIDPPTYAYVFDWLSSNYLDVCVGPGFAVMVYDTDNDAVVYTGEADGWREAADLGIGKAMEALCLE